MDVPENDNGNPNPDPRSADMGWWTYRRLVLNELKSIREKLDGFEEQYVKKVEFIPIRNFTYALISVVLVAVLTAILTLVLRGHT